MQLLTLCKEGAIKLLKRSDEVGTTQPITQWLSSFKYTVMGFTKASMQYI